MRWRSQSDWENMFATDAMQKVFAEHAPLLSIRPAEAFTEVK